LKKDWEQTQIKVFSRWSAKQLQQRQIPFDSVLTDFKDGVKLINLLEIVGKEPMPGKWKKTPTNDYARLENITLAIKYITEVKKVRLVGIGSQNVLESDVDENNRKLTLGLVWSIINKFIIEDISVEEATARDALLIWAKKNTQGYADVNVTNFTTSWSTGLAFCALINKFRPNLLDYNALDRSDHMEACRKAFAACKELGIYVYLDPEDLVDTQPDEKSVVTQVAEFFHFFAGESKTQAMADKLKRTISIQKQIDELKSTYIEDAKAAMEKMTVEEDKLNAADYEKTVPGTKGKLLEVIKYARTARPEIVEHRAKAMRSWAALSTKCNSSNRPIPAVPEGLEPEALTAKFTSIENTSATRRTELTNELKELQKQKITEFDAKCQEITGKIEEIEKNCNEMEGETQEKIEKANGFLNEADGLHEAVSALDAPFQELVELKLNNRTKTTAAAVGNLLAQLISHIKHIIEQLNGKLYDENNKARIDAYNAKAAPYAEAANAFKEECSTIAGELAERRATYLAKQAELPAKRESVNELNADFADLEKDSLQLTIENTPTAISSIYNAALQIIVDGLQKCYEEMVANFDAIAVPLVDQIREVLATAKGFEGEATEIKGKLEEQLQAANAIEEKIPALAEPFQELVQYKLNFRAKYTDSDVKEELQQTIATINHLITSNETEITEQEQNARIAAYTTKADAYMEEAAKFDGQINDVKGELEEKRTALFAIEKEVNAKVELLAELAPIYEDLEKDELHLEITNTPSAITDFYNNLIQHIQTLVREIDQAVAAAKGMEISEEQLAEFRDTFSHFDKDGSKALEYYELKACLTTLGEDITDDQAKAYCKQYSAEGKENMLFDEYAKFMLEHFSKAETADSTMEAFKAIANGNPVLNDAQIAQYFSEEDAAYLKTQLTPVEGGYDFASWVNTLYA
jgi:actinin alpha